MVSSFWNSGIASGYSGAKFDAPDSARLHHLVRQILDPRRPMRPVLAQDRLGPLLGDIGLHGGNLGIGVAEEVVDRHDHRHAEALHVGDVAAKVRAALLHGLHVLGPKVGLRHPAVHLHRADRRHDHRRRRLQPGLAALDVEELLRAEVSPESRLRSPHIRPASARSWSR
jgi:hypothetical protein